MSIIYVVIAKSDEKILCEYTDFVGNFEQISRSLLKEINAEHRATFSYDDTYFFHYLNSNKITYMCMCNDQFTKRSAYTFLDDIKKTYLNTFSQREIEQSISYTFSDSFKDKIRAKIEYYNNRTDEIEAISRALNNNEGSNQSSASDNSLLESCIDKTHVDIIVDKPLFESLNIKNKEVTKKRRGIRMKRLKVLLMILTTFLLMSYFISVVSCGGFDWKGCRNE